MKRSSTLSGVFGAGIVVATFVFSGIFTGALDAQGQPTSANAKPEGRVSTLKTPWGDPDLQGTWSSDDLRGVPMQRPDEFAGRAELSDVEFSKRLSANQEARTRELNRVGAFRNDVGTRTFRMTSLVVEPADGKIPPLTP